MRPAILTLALGALALAALPLPSHAAGSDFDIRGRWAAEGKACDDAKTFVEFDGRAIIGSNAEIARARLAAYSAALADGGLVLSVTDAGSEAPDQWRFVIDGSNAIRLDSAFFAKDGLMTLTRCPSGI